MRTILLLCCCLIFCNSHSKAFIINKYNNVINNYNVISSTTTKGKLSLSYYYHRQKILFSTSDNDATSSSSSTNDDNNSNHMIIQLNHAGASPSPQSVIDRVWNHLQLEQKIGAYAAAQVVQEELSLVYKNIATLLHANSPLEIALVESATVAWTRIFYTLVEIQKQQHVDKKHVILISNVEYAANVVAACQWANRQQQQQQQSPPWIVLSIPCNESQPGVVDIQQFTSMLQGSYEYRVKDENNNNDNTKLLKLNPKSIAMVCITHVPTNCGIVNPICEIGTLLQEFNNNNNNNNNRSFNNNFPNIFYLVDACQSVGQMDINVQNIYCHGLVATGRKYLRGPRGTGFLYMPLSIANNTATIPHHIDHYGVPIQTVPKFNSYNNGDLVNTAINYQPRVGATRFEFWESNIANKLGLGVAVQYAMSLGLSSYIQNNCLQLAMYLKDELCKINHVVVHHGSTLNCGIVTFYFDNNDDYFNMDTHTARDHLQAKGFVLSIVPATSTPIDSSMSGVPDLIRASVSYTNTKQEIDMFCEAVAALVSSNQK